MNTPYDAIRIANYIAHKGYINNLTNIKLQKILYLLQYVYLREKGVPFFSNKIEAWRAGPCIPDVYFRFTSFGTKNISVPYINGLRAEGNILNKHQHFIDDIVRRISQLSIFHLMDITQSHTAWRDAYFNESDQTISVEAIKNTKAFKCAFHK